MKILQLERGKGKTTALVYTSAMTGYPIIASSEAHIRNIINTANKLGVDIPNPINFYEYRSLHVPFHLDNVLIDDLEIMLPMILNDYFNTNVIGVTINK